MAVRVKRFDPPPAPPPRGPIAFDVPGEPIPKGSGGLVFSKSTGRVFYKPDRERDLKAWARVLNLCARAALAGAGPWPGAVHVSLVFRLAPPAKQERSWPAVRPDVDKLARAVLDALTGAAWIDDGQVCTLEVMKWYAAPGEVPGVKVKVDAIPDALAEAKRARAAARINRAQRS